MTLVASALAGGPRVADIDDAGALRAGSTQHSGNGSLNHVNEDDAFATTGMLRWPRGSANLRRAREGRAVHLWASQATTLDRTGVKWDTPSAALVATNEYMGARARI